MVNELTVIIAPKNESLGQSGPIHIFSMYPSSLHLFDNPLVQLICHELFLGIQSYAIQMRPKGVQNLRNQGVET